MQRFPTLTPRDAREKDVIDLWRAGGMAWGTVAVYLVWVRRWRAHWQRQGIADNRRLTYAAVTGFVAGLIGRRYRRPISRASRAAARNSLHAWSCALQELGEAVPCWRSMPSPTRLPVLLRTYVEHRRAHRGVASGTVRRDVEVASAFLAVLRSRRRSIATARIAEVDALVDGMPARWSRSTVASWCSSLRCFLRFLRTTGRIRRDLASAVVGPRVRARARPARALPWADIRRIIRAVPHRRPAELRDRAILLLLASYGMGSSEVARLRLDDIDWSGKILRVYRQKTGTLIELPLLPLVGRAVAAYLRRGRPTRSAPREVFLTVGLPHRPITANVVRHQVRKYARAVGIPPEFHGSHVFRHSHATRQIDLGASPKIVSDILGHRHPSSMSVYVRVAIRRLRTVALPVPR